MARFKGLFLAKEQYYLARNKYHKAIAKALPTGTTVRWMHGKQNRSGTVLDVSFDRVKVRSDVGRFWIYIDRIISLTRKDDKLQGGS